MGKNRKTRKQRQKIELLEKAMTASEPKVLDVERAELDSTEEFLRDNADESLEALVIAEETTDQIDEAVVTDEGVTTESELEQVPVQNLDAEIDAIEAEAAEEPDSVTSQMIAIKSEKTDEITVKKPRFYVKIWFWLLMLVLLGASIFVGYKISTFEEVVIAGHRYQKQSAEQIVAEVINSAKDQAIIFQLPDKPVVELTLGNAGINVDAERLTEEIKQARQLNLANLFFKPSLEVPFLIDYPVLQSALDDNFKDGLVQPVDANLSYNRNQNKFIITSSLDGYRVDARAVLPDSSVIKSGQAIKIAVWYQAVQPTIKTENLTKTADYLNQRIALRINLNHNGKLLYFADPWDIAAWAELTPNLTAGSIDVTFNKQKIQDFIEKTVSPQIARGVVNRKLLVNDNNEVLQVLQQGRRGLGAVNAGDSAAKIYQAVVDNSNVDIELNVQEIDFAEERIAANGLKWIEVNLSKQTTTLYSGETALQTFVISSGVQPWPTPTGTFYVWHKNPRQTMTGGSRAAGDYYSLPNVTWNTYFTHSGVGFHTAYWHNNFGRPMSHGCINMREADAKVVYEFAPIGTMVVVRY